MTENNSPIHSVKLILFAFIAIIGATPFSIHSQDTYEEYVQQYMKGLSKFKNERDSAFSVMLKQQWEVFNASQGRAPEQKPVPPKPYVIEKPTKPVDFEIKVTPKPVVTPQPTPTVTPEKPTITPKPQPKPTIPEKTIVPTPEKPTITPTPQPKPTIPEKTIVPTPEKPTIDSTPKPTPSVDPVIKPVKPIAPKPDTKKPEKPGRPIAPKPDPVQKPEKPTKPVKPVEPKTEPVKKPTKPVEPIKTPTETPKPTKPNTEVVTPIKPPVTSKPEKPVENRPAENSGIDSYGKGNCNIQFYGTSVNIPMPADMRFTLSNLSENEISKTWDLLSGTEYRTVINSCLDAKKALNLNDWLYVKMVKTLSDKWENNRKSESNLLAMFILLQSGYKVKVANCAGKLVLLYSTSNVVYAVNYLTIDNDCYYILDEQGEGNYSYSTYRGNFGSNLNTISFKLASAPNIKNTPVKTVRRNSGAIDLKVSMNKNLIDAYNDFPLCDYSVYVHTPVSQELKRDVINPLRQFISGKSELESAGNLLNFVQKGFEYQTDEQQFGEERPFFVDESFFFPYNDCEDRSMVYSMLVSELLGLDVILLEYPNHVATAVNFKSEVKGDYVMFEGKRYTVCDPTCINAQVGVTMPQFRKTSPEAKRY